MTFYTQSITTEIIDPVFHQGNYRDEFRIVKDGLYLTNMRIHNLGLYGNIDANDNEVSYNFLAGSHGAISNIYLYDGKQILDQVINYNIKGAFNEYNKTNTTNQDIAKFGSRTGLGFVCNREPQLQTSIVTNQKKALVTEFYANSPREMGLDQESSPMGFLNLQAVFPLLKALQFIHTGIFKNLRVVIEYKKNVNALSGPNGDTFSSTSLPILVVDAVNDAELAKKVLSDFKPIVWSAQEVEQVYLPPDTASGKFRLNAFAGKTLNSILIQKSSTTSVSKLYKSLCSEAVADESIQIVVNGSNLFPQAIDRPMMRLDLLTQTLGNCNSHTSSSGLSTYLPYEVVAGVSRIVGLVTTQYATSDDRTGRLDYFACVVNKQISSFDLVYSRNVGAGVAPRYTQGLYINVFGNVVKTILPSKNGGYAVQYV